MLFFFFFLLPDGEVAEAASGEQTLSCLMSAVCPGVAAVAVCPRWTRDSSRFIFPDSDDQVSARCVLFLRPAAVFLPPAPLPVWPSSPSSRSPSVAPLSYADVLSLILSPEIN